jgi:hypothetical protein
MEDDFRVDYITNSMKKEFTANNNLRFAQQTEHLTALLREPLLRLQAVMSNQERAPKIHGTTIEAVRWWADNIDQILVDRSKAKQFKTIAEKVQAKVVAGYNEETKPKYDPDMIEGALDCIKEVLKEL